MNRIAGVILSALVVMMIIPQASASSGTHPKLIQNPGRFIDVSPALWIGEINDAIGIVSSGAAGSAYTLVSRDGKLLLSRLYPDLHIASATRVGNTIYAASFGGEIVKISPDGRISRVMALSSNESGRAIAFAESPRGAYVLWDSESDDSLYVTLLSIGDKPLWTLKINGSLDVIRPLWNPILISGNGELYVLLPSVKTWSTKVVKISGNGELVWGKEVDGFLATSGTWSGHLILAGLVKGGILHQNLSLSLLPIPFVEQGFYTSAPGIIGLSSSGVVLYSREYPTVVAVKTDAAAELLGVTDATNSPSGPWLYNPIFVPVSVIKAGDGFVIGMTPLMGSLSEEISDFSGFYLLKISGSGKPITGTVLNGMSPGKAGGFSRNIVVASENSGVLSVLMLNSELEKVWNSDFLGSQMVLDVLPSGETLWSVVNLTSTPSLAAVRYAENGNVEGAFLMEGNYSLLASAAGGDRLYILLEDNGTQYLHVLPDRVTYVLPREERKGPFRPKTKAMLIGTEYGVVVKPKDSRSVYYIRPGKKAYSLSFGGGSNSYVTFETIEGGAYSNGTLVLFDGSVLMFFREGKDGLKYSGAFEIPGIQTVAGSSGGLYALSRVEGGLRLLRLQDGVHAFKWCRGVPLDYFTSLQRKDYPLWVRGNFVVLGLPHYSGTLHAFMVFRSDGEYVGSAFPPVYSVQTVLSANETEIAVLGNGGELIDYPLEKNNTVSDCTDYINDRAVEKPVSLSPVELKESSPRMRKLSPEEYVELLINPSGRVHRPAETFTVKVVEGSLKGLSSNNTSAVIGYDTISPSVEPLKLSWARVEGSLSPAETNYEVVDLYTARETSENAGKTQNSNPSETSTTEKKTSKGICGPALLLPMALLPLLWKRR